MSAGRKVVLLCLDPVPVSRHGERHPFNYAVRRVQAHLLTSNLDGLEVHLVESRSPDVDEFVARIEEIDPDVIGASIYVWSFGILLDVVAKVKQRRPDTVVVFGGPSARPSMFGRPPYYERRFDVDALALGEGEELFAQIVALQDRSPASLARLPGLVLPTADGWHRTSPAAEIVNLDALASPYVLGLTQNSVTAQIESFRGCPLSCSFCQWGDLSNKSRVFSKEYLARDFEVMQRAGLKNAFVVDAALNLNPRGFRNLAAAARESGATKNMLLSFEVYPSHLTDEHVAFLEECSVGVELGLGLQSFDKEVLRKMQRPFDEKRFEEVARMLSSIGCTVAIEIIMGLPGDNPDSFLRTLERAQNLPCEVRVFHCLVLPDALMDRAPPWADMKFDPVSLKMQSCAGWSERELMAMVERLDGMQQFETHGETAWSWQFPSKVREPTTARQRQFKAKTEQPALPRSTPGQRIEAPSPHLVSAVAVATNHRWSVSRVERVDGLTLLHPQGEAADIIVEIAPAAAVPKAFRVVDGVAVSYRSAGQVTAETLAVLEQLTVGASAALRELVSEVDAGGALPDASEGEPPTPQNRRVLPVLE